MNTAIARHALSPLCSYDDERTNTGHEHHHHDHHGTRFERRRPTGIGAALVKLARASGDGDLILIVVRAGQVEARRRSNILTVSTCADRLRAMGCGCSGVKLAVLGDCDRCLGVDGRGCSSVAGRTFRDRDGLWAGRRYESGS